MSARDEVLVLDVDAGSGAGVSAKVVGLIDAEAFAERREERSGNRDLDRLIQETPGYRQASKDAGSAFPRDATRSLRHPAMARRMPEPDEQRAPISARQKGARSLLKNAVQNRMSSAQHAEFARLIGTRGAWDALNDELWAAVGNLQELGETSKRRVRRLDTGIQSYEEQSGRSSVVYVTARLPEWVPASRAAEYLQGHFAEGDEITFDRYTMATHQLHEQERNAPSDGGAVVVFEIQTRRGMYLGGARGQDTSQLLPRSMQTRVVCGANVARYRRPDGSTGQTIVIQLADS